MGYYEAAGSHILHFGVDGDIHVAHGRTADRVDPGDNEIVFVLGKPGRVGRVTTEEPGADGTVMKSLEGVLSSDVDAPVRLIFETVDSLDVVLEMMLKLRAKMVEANRAYLANPSQFPRETVYMADEQPGGFAPVPNPDGPAPNDPPVRVAPSGGSSAQSAQKEAELLKDIEQTLNRHSVENESDTPDFVLALFVRASLGAFASAVNAREKYYGRWERGLGSVSEGVAPAGVSVGEAIERIQQLDEFRNRFSSDRRARSEEVPTIAPGSASASEGLTFAASTATPGLGDLPFAFSKQDVERLVTEYETQSGKLPKWFRDLVWTELWEGDSCSVSQALVALLNEMQLKIHNAQESSNDGSTLSARAADLELSAAFDAAAPDGEPSDPKAAAAAMLRADLRLLLVGMRDQNNRDGVKCRHLSMAISHAEDAYLRLGAMTADRPLDF